MDNMTYDVNELMQLASAQGLELCNEIYDTTPKPRYLSREKLLNHRVVYDMPNETYHAHATSISSSTVKHATTPIMYAKYLKDGFSIKNNACLIIGTALHEMLLESEKEHNYVLYDEELLLEEVHALRPEAKSLKATKEWKELIAPFLKDDGSGHFLDNVVSTEQYCMLQNQALRLKKHPELATIYNNAKAEVSFFAQFADIDVRIRPDLFKIADEADVAIFEKVSVGDAIIMSVKTTIDASPKGFARECRKRDYLLAESFYHDVLSSITNTRVHIMILAVEKDKNDLMTGQAMLYLCTDNHITNGRNQYESNLEVIMHCRKNPVNSLQGYEFHNNNSIIMELQ